MSNKQEIFHRAPASWKKEREDLLTENDKRVSRVIGLNKSIGSKKARVAFRKVATLDWSNKLDEQK